MRFYLFRFFLSAPLATTMPILVPSPSLTLTACWLRMDIWEQANVWGAGDNISQWNFPRPMSWPNVVVFAVCDVMDATLNCFASEGGKETEAEFF